MLKKNGNYTTKEDFIGKVLNQEVTMDEIQEVIKANSHEIIKKGSEHPWMGRDLAYHPGHYTIQTDENDVITSIEEG